MINGVTSSQVTNAYTSVAADYAKEKSNAAEKSTATEAAEVAAVYEPSEKTTESSSAKIYSPNTELVNKLKQEAEARTNSLKTLVEQLITKQATTNGNATDIWSFLKSGEYTVDPETKAQAQKDIAEDGYWGVNQTSDRIISFATALTGGDPDKLDEMIEAFKKGYKQAEKTWGGELPEISQKTYDAVLEKFEELRNQYSQE